MTYRAMVGMLVLASLWGTQIPVVRASPTSRPTKRAKPKKPLSLEALMMQKIRRVGPGQVSIPPEAKRYYLDQLSYVKLKVLVDPYVYKGRSIGFSLLYVSKKSPLLRAGFLEKDVIMSVNGRDVHSTYQAMLAYLKLQDARRYVFRILRKGKTHTITISVKAR